MGPVSGFLSQATLNIRKEGLPFTRYAIVR